MKKAERRLNKTIRKIVAITDGMDKCSALDWLSELQESIDFQIGIIKDDIRAKVVTAESTETAETVLSKLGESQNRRKGKKKTKKAASEEAASERNHGRRLA